MPHPLFTLRTILLFSFLSLATAQQDVEVLIGQLSDVGGHSVAGTVYALNSRQLRIKGLEYDGAGPAAVFWTGTDFPPTPNGLGVPFRDDCVFNPQLPAYSGQTVDLELPDGKTLADVDYISIWCERVGVDFGSVQIDASALQGVPDLAQSTCSEDGQASGDAQDPQDQPAEQPFPVAEGWNCEELSDDFQARWVIDGDDVNVELVGRTGADGYMGFGVSGSDDRTNMDGSDVVIAYRNEESFEAVDFHMNKRVPCTNGEGVCPDEDLNPNKGKNDVSKVSGESNGDLTRVSYTRPLTAADNTADRPISTTGQTFITWALGPLNRKSLLPLRHGDTSFPKGDVAIIFAREPQNSCTKKLFAQEEKSVPGFIRPTISNTTEITARIGPPGGTRGYGGITGGPSWGFAWYMSPTGSSGQDVLIPAIAVERGKTYTFTVQGGRESDSEEAHHPLYITDSPAGGYAVSSPEERSKEKIYAGIDDIVTDANGGVTSFRGTATGALCRITSSLAGDTAETETWDDYAKTLDVSCAQDESITSDAGTLTWKVPEDAPDELYYQCITHPFLGYKFVVFDEGKVDMEVLETASGGGELKDVSNGDKECTVTFKGQPKAFSGCLRGLTGDVEVYWTIRESDGEIETLFRAPTNGGYVGFGWGYAEMLGSNVAIAFQDKDGNAKIDDYFLEGRDSEDVQPNDKQKLTGTDAAIDGEFVAGLFTRKLESDGIPTITVGWTPAIWAVGKKPDSASKLVEHDIQGSGEINLSETSGDVVVFSRNSNFFMAHAALMLIAWLALTPAAVVIMTHLKGYNPAAFQVHRGLNVLSIVIVIIAYIMAVVRGSHTATAHLVLGTIAFVFAIVQAASGVFRPHKGTAGRRGWYLQHAFTGHTALMVAIANALVGMLTTSVFDVSAAWYVAWGVLLGAYLLAHVALFLLRSRLVTPEAEKKPELSPA